MSALALLFALAPAQAAPPEPAPFAWKWAEAPTHWHVEAATVTPRGTRYRAVDNVDARAAQVLASGDATCSFKPAKKGWDASCRFDWVQLSGTSIVDREQKALETVLAEWSGALQQASYTFKLSPEGRMKDFDMDAGRERQNLRDGGIIEAQRALAQRLFCLFDLPVGKDAADWKRGWKHTGDNQVLRLQTVSGTAGAAEVKRTRQEDKFGLLTVSDEGRATLSPGGAVDSGGTKIIDVRLEGQSQLDPADGTLAFRAATLDGRLTASSQNTGTDFEFYFVAGMQRLAQPGQPGSSPLPIGAQRAPRLAGKAPETETALVEFGSLGMQAFFVEGIPEEAKASQIPTTTVRARVWVRADGTVEKVVPWEGFAVLSTPTETALRGATFPKRDAPYAVDVGVEWREKKER